MTPSGFFGLMSKGGHRRGLSPPSSNYMLGGGWLWTQIASKICSGEIVFGEGSRGCFLDDGFVCPCWEYVFLRFSFFVRSNFLFFCAVEFFAFRAVELLFFCAVELLHLSGRRVIRGCIFNQRETESIIPNILTKKKKSLRKT